MRLLDTKTDINHPMTVLILNSPRNHGLEGDETTYFGP